MKLGCQDLAQSGLERGQCVPARYGSEIGFWSAHTHLRVWLPFRPRTESGY